MYDQAHYKFDRGQIDHDALLAEGAILYRLTSPTHARPEDVLSGSGTMYTRSDGRWNRRQQQATYVANNILVCFSEVLYHMYRTVLERIKERQSPKLIDTAVRTQKILAIARVGEITDLVYIDSEYFRTEYEPRVSGTTVVYPDPYYAVFWELNERLRSEFKKGVLYPSARHSRDICVALFDNETSRIDRASYEILGVTLRLIVEDQGFEAPLKTVRPTVDKIHPTMGYYAFDDEAELARLDGAGMLHPAGLSKKGFVDFVRRHYRGYPDQAICKCA